MRKLWAISLIAIATSAHADLFKPSKNDQVKLGQKAAQEIRLKEKVLPASDNRVKVLRSIAERIVKQFDDSKEPWKYSFDVVDSKDINAFALPGGPVFFYTGLLNKLKTEDELAAVLGHELIHVRKEHWAYGYAEQQKRDLVLAGILIFGRVGRTAGDVLGIGSELLMGLPFSRKHESEADRLGFDAMVSAGFNPQGMADVFTFLSKANKGGKPPEFLSTHPDDGKRVAKMNEMIVATGKKFGPQKPLPWNEKTYKDARTLRWHW